MGAIIMLRIVIVSWNVKDLVTRCIESIVAMSSDVDYDIVVVDNASKDGTQQILQDVVKKYAYIQAILNPTNRGFAAACNQGINVQGTMRNERSPNYYLLLNPDTEMSSDVLKRMVAWMNNHPKAGIAGCMLKNPNGTIQPSIRRFPTLFSQLLIAIKVHHLTKNLVVLHHYFWSDFDYSQEREVDQVMGAFFMVRRSCWDELQGLDERFFIWFEEVDFCLRAMHAGWQVWYVPISGVVHHAHASFKKQSFFIKQRNFFSSMIKYFLKHRLRIS